MVYADAKSFARCLAPVLPDGPWEVEHTEGVVAYLRADGDRRLLVDPAWNGGVRVSIRALYPSGTYRPTPDAPKEITVSTTRPLESLARDITRRVLLPYGPALLAAKQQQADREAAAARRAAITARIVAALPGATEVDHTPNSVWGRFAGVGEVWNRHDGSMRCTVSDTCGVELHLHRLTADQAVAVLKVLAESL